MVDVQDCSGSQCLGSFGQFGIEGRRMMASQLYQVYSNGLYLILQWQEGWLLAFHPHMEIPVVRSFSRRNTKPKDSSIRSDIVVGIAVFVATIKERRSQKQPAKGRKAGFSPVAES
jgi:hypothetical protein